MDEMGEGPTINSFIQDIMQYSVVHSFYKYQSAHWAFRRMTFIQSDYCYVCEKSTSEIDVCKIDNHLGNFLYGWIFCPDCKPYVMHDKYIREKNMEVLPKTSYNHLYKTIFRFWRQSSNPTISPYLQEHAKLEIDSGNAFEFKPKYNTLCVSINWDTDSDGNLCKAIPLANLIFYNRNIFGYRPETMVNTILSRSKLIHDVEWLNKWTSRIHEHYIHANGWLEMYKIATRYKIPREIILDIMNLWGMFSLGKHYV